MGFRSTFTSEHKAVKWPEWFKEKYAGWIYFPVGAHGPISSTQEAKTYGVLIDLPEDIQKVLAVDDEQPDTLVLVFLHECGGISRCEIERESVTWTEPTKWRKTDHVEHHYCYGCSDAKTVCAASSNGEIVEKW